METFEEVQRFLSSIGVINFGGCGVAAVAMYLWLEEHGQLGADDKIMYLYRNYSFSSYTQNQKLIENNGGNGSSCSHAVLKYRGCLIDCEEKVSSKDYAYKQTFNDINLVRLTLNNIHSWNECFDRSRFIPLIEKKLKVKIFEN
jgi:hypothetical protein